jgi:hypothetical protein
VSILRSASGSGMERGAGASRSVGSSFEAGEEAKVWSFIGRIESTRIDVDMSVYKKKKIVLALQCNTIACCICHFS